MRRAVVVAALATIAFACGTELAASSEGAGSDAGADAGGAGDANEPVDGAPVDAGADCGASCEDVVAPPAATALTPTSTYAFGPLARMATIPGTTDLAVSVDGLAAGPCVLRASRNVPGVPTTVGANGTCRYLATSSSGVLYWARVEGGSESIASSGADFATVDAGGTVVGVAHALSLLYFGTSAPCRIYHVPEGAGGALGALDQDFGEPCSEISGGGISVVAAPLASGKIGRVNRAPNLVAVSGKPASVAVDDGDRIFYISAKPSIQELGEVPPLTSSVDPSARALAFYDPELMWIEKDGIHAILREGGGAPRLVAASKTVVAFTADDQAIYYAADGRLWRVPR